MNAYILQSDDLNKDLEKLMFKWDREDRLQKAKEGFLESSTWEELFNAKENSFPQRLDDLLNALMEGDSVMAKNILLSVREAAWERHLEREQFESAYHDYMDRPF